MGIIGFGGGERVGVGGEEDVGRWRTSWMKMKKTKPVMRREIKEKMKKTKLWENKKKKDKKEK